MEGASAGWSDEPVDGIYSFLFSDIDESTSLWLSDPEGMSKSLAVHDAAMRRVIADTGGILFTTAGDSFHTAYQEPHDALKAALEARRVLTRVSWGRVGPLRDRYALHVGWAEWRQSDFFGPEVIRCARFLDVAQPNQIVMSASFAEAVAGTTLASLVQMGNHALKGFDHPTAMFAVH